MLACFAVIIARGEARGACSDPIDAPAAVQVGDRLFRETRFAQFFFNFITAAPNRNVNTTLKPGDPTVSVEQNAAGKPLRDPFRNQSMNCRNCHLGNDLLGTSRLDGRTYCDFARRSPIPARSDGLSTTPRNAQPMVSVSISRQVPFLFHFDGEFASIEDLTLGTLTGRNFGWLPSEFAQAEAHIINVIKNDNGKNALARRYGCGGFPYSVVLLGTDPKLPKGLVLPPQYRIDLTTASDDAIMQDVGSLILAYMNSIAFNLNEPPSLLRNDLRGGHHWLKVKLIGTKSNRSAIGARVLVRYGKKTQAQALTSQSSFYSSNDPRLHFGLGPETTADIEIHWPNGLRENLKGIAADQLVTIQEGTGVVPSKGWGKRVASAG